MFFKTALYYLRYLGDKVVFPVIISELFWTSRYIYLRVLEWNWRPPTMAGVSVTKSFRIY